MQEGEQRIRGILKEIKGKENPEIPGSEILGRYVNNYAEGILLSLIISKSPATPEQERLEIQKLYKRRVFFLLLSKRKLSQKDGEDFYAYLAEKFYTEKKYDSRVLEDYFQAITTTQ